MENKKMKNIKFKTIIPVQVECNAFVPEEYDVDVDTLTLESWIKENVHSCVISTNISNIEANIPKAMDDYGMLRVSYEPIIETLEDLINALQYPKYSSYKVYLNYKNLGLLPLNSSQYYIENEVIYFEGHDLNTKDCYLTSEVFIDALDSEISSFDWEDENQILNYSIIICRNDRIIKDCFDIANEYVEEFTIKSVRLNNDSIILDLE